MADQKKSSLDMGSLKADFGAKLKPLARHHITVAFVVILGFLAYTIYSINQTLLAPADPSYEQEKRAETISTRFDQDTIDQINQLRSRQEDASLELPPGRISPFQE